MSTLNIPKATQILGTLLCSENYISVIKNWYAFIGNNRTEEELDHLYAILSWFFNKHYTIQCLKHTKLFIVLGSALIENDQDDSINTICLKLTKDVNSLDESDTKMLLRFIEM